MKEDLSKKINYWTGVIVLGCMLGFSVQIVNGWVKPAETPPDGNVSGLVNVGNVSQYKAGGLGIGMTALPTEKLEVGGNLKMQNTSGRGQIIFNSANPGSFGATAAGYNTINTNSRKGYIGIYGGPDWDDGGAIEVTGADFYGTESDRGAVAISFVGGTDGRHNGFYVVDSTNRIDLPFVVARIRNNDSVIPWRVNMPRTEMNLGGKITISNRDIGGKGRGQIIFNSDDPGTFGATTSGYNTINTNSRKGYIGIYGGPNWTDGGAVEVGGADFNGTESDRGAVAISFVGGTDGHHNGFYVVDSTDTSELLLSIKRVGNSADDTPWRANMKRTNLVVQRNIYASSFHTFSDERLKDNVSEIGNALDKIDQLKGVSFSWKEGGEKTMGFLAQEVEKVFPELVNLEKEEDPNSYKSVEYANLTAPLVEAVKELKKRDETNKQKITELESAIGDLRMEIEQLKNK